MAKENNIMGISDSVNCFPLVGHKSVKVEKDDNKDDTATVEKKKKTTCGQGGFNS